MRKQELAPPAIVRQSADLAELAARINAEHGAGESATRRGLEHYRTCGEFLLRAKAACRHGEWLTWLKANVKVSERHVRNYMALAKSATVADLEEAWRTITGRTEEPESDEPASAGSKVSLFSGDSEDDDPGTADKGGELEPSGGRMPMPMADASQKTGGRLRGSPSKQPASPASAAQWRTEAEALRVQHLADEATATAQWLDRLEAVTDLKDWATLAASCPVALMPAFLATAACGQLTRRDRAVDSWVPPGGFRGAGMALPGGDIMTFKAAEFTATRVESSLSDVLDSEAPRQYLTRAQIENMLRRLEEYKQENELTDALRAVLSDGPETVRA